MKKRLIWGIGFLIVAAVIAVYIQKSMPSEKRAIARVQEFAEAINYQYETPGNIYKYLTAELREQMTEEEFIEAFATERTYPYLSPLFINYDSIEMSKDKKSGTATFSQAARLPGMIYEVNVVFENGDYYIDTFHEYADGSYLEKFEILAEQSDWVDTIFSKENSLKP